jgi:predicted RNA binding protein YcfA (HicA-like mRNA interferase family)
VSERLPSVRSRQLIRVLENKGWKLARSKGSHRHFTHPDSPNIITVAVHAKDIKRGTLSGILADAGISRQDFLRLLKR